MKTELEYYDIYPKIISTEKEALITIKPMSGHVAFHKEKEYRVKIAAMNETLLNCKGETYPLINADFVDGVLQIRYHFRTEQQYALILEENGGETWERRCELRVYALEPDIFCLRPFRGDMHCHTYRSDGVESPDIVAANYRKAGFDFLSITDHSQYEPSQEAIHAYEALDLDFRLFSGEEVHPPENNTHTVNFGADYSINSIFRNEPERYEREVNEIEKSLHLPDGINSREYASLLWVYQNIRAANGMAIMAHPCWIQDDAYHIRRSMYRYLLETQPFDALELTCGQSREENQMQITFWQQMRENGYVVPVVGNSDSHGTVNSNWFNLSKMIVLAKQCTRDDIIESVKTRRAVVLEQYHGEELPRIYGEGRITDFVLFLLTEYMPLHDELCVEEGRLMREYANGDINAGEKLKAEKGKIPSLTKKYWQS